MGDNHEPAGIWAILFYLICALYLVGGLLYGVGASILG